MLVDLLFIIICVFMCFSSGRNGFINEVCGLAGWIISIYVSFNFYEEIIEALGLNSDSLTIIFVVIGTFIVSLLLCTLFSNILSSLVSITGLGIVNMFFGLAVGLAKTVALICLTVFIVEAIAKIIGYSALESVGWQSSYCVEVAKNLINNLVS